MVLRGGRRALIRASLSLSLFLAVCSPVLPGSVPAATSSNRREFYLQTSGILPSDGPEAWAWARAMPRTLSVAAWLQRPTAAALPRTARPPAATAAWQAVQARVAQWLVVAALVPRRGDPKSSDHAGVVVATAAAAAAAATAIAAAATAGLPRR